MQEIDSGFVSDLRVCQGITQRTVSVTLFVDMGGLFLDIFVEYLFRVFVRMIELLGRLRWERY